MADTIRRYFLAFLLAAALLLAALNGGSYDDVARGEAFFAVWWVVGLSALFGLLPQSRPPLEGRVAFAALLALAGWIALGATWSLSVGRTLHEVSRTLGLAGVLLLVTWSFGPRSWRHGAAAATVVAVVVCCLAFTSRLAPNLLTDALQRSGYSGRRLSYPFNYWNAAGVWAAMTVGLALSWSVHAERWWQRAPALAGVCVAGPVAYMTYSRSALIGVAVAAVTVIALSRHRWLAALNVLLAGAGSALVIAAIRAHPQIAQGSGTSGAGSVALIMVLVIAAAAVAAYTSSVGGVDGVRMPPRIARIVVGCACGVVLVAGVAVGPALARDAWDSFQQRQSNALTADPARRLTNLSGERRNLWGVAIDAFRGHVLKGTGAGTYEFLWNRDRRWSHHVLDAHSLYIEDLAEIGLPGTLLVVVALGALLVAALREPFRQREAPAAGAAVGCTAALLVFCITAGVDWMWESTALAAMALSCGGVAVAASGTRAGDRRALPRASAGLLALVVLGLQTPSLIAAFQVRSSQTAVREHRPEDAVADASGALHAEPWSSAGYFQRALVLEQYGFLDAAANDARKAVGKDPYEAEMWLVLGRIEVERAHVKAAIAAARRARSLNPRNPLLNP